MLDDSAGPEWFTAAGLGIFIHFGHAASRGWELSWQMTGGVAGQFPPREPVPCAEYFANAAEFDPAHFDAEQWANDIANSGARYAIFTAKHHDGFAMYDTAFSDYSIARGAPFGRDLLAELFDALRRRGIRVGIYLSLVDWHHPEYPPMTDATLERPYQLGSWQRTSPEQWQRFRAFFIDQLTELLTRYGQIDVMWFDGEFEHTAEEWDFADIRATVRALQPGCLVNDRCVGYGDFATPEQQRPARAPDVPWEVCLTMNDSWGWTSDDDRWKSVPDLITRLAETAAAGGNLLLNVGPRGDGQFPIEAQERLKAVGDWMRLNGPAVGGVNPLPDTLRSPVPIGVRTGPAGSQLFVYCTMRPYDSIRLSGVPVKRVRAVSVLGIGRELDFAAIPSLPEVHAGKSDPLGDLEIHIPAEVAELLVPVLLVEIAPE